MIYWLSGISCGMKIHSLSFPSYGNDKMSLYSMPRGHGVEVDDTPFG